MFYLTKVYWIANNKELNFLTRHYKSLFLKLFPKYLSKAKKKKTKYKNKEKSKKY